MQMQMQFWKEQLRHRNVSVAASATRTAAACACVLLVPTRVISTASHPPFPRDATARQHGSQGSSQMAKLRCTNCNQ